LSNDFVGAREGILIGISKCDNQELALYPEINAG